MWKCQELLFHILIPSIKLPSNQTKSSHTNYRYLSTSEKLDRLPIYKNSLLRWRWSISRLNQPHNCQLWCILGWKHVWPSSGHAGRGKQVVQKCPRLLPSNFLAATEGTQPTSTPHTHTPSHTYKQIHGGWWFEVPWLLIIVFNQRETCWLWATWTSRNTTPSWLKASSMSIIMMSHTRHTHTQSVSYFCRLASNFAQDQRGVSVPT